MACFSTCCEPGTIPYLHITGFLLCLFTKEATRRRSSMRLLVHAADEHIIHFSLPLTVPGFQAHIVERFEERRLFLSLDLILLRDMSGNAHAHSGIGAIGDRGCSPIASALMLISVSNTASLSEYNSFQVFTFLSQ